MKYLLAAAILATSALQGCSRPQPATKNKPEGLIGGAAKAAWDATPQAPPAETPQALTKGKGHATPGSPPIVAGKWYVRNAGSGGPMSGPYMVFQATGDPKQYDLTWYIMAGPFDTQAQAKAWPWPFPWRYGQP